MLFISQHVLAHAGYIFGFILLSIVFVNFYNFISFLFLQQDEEERKKTEEEEKKRKEEEDKKKPEEKKEEETEVIINQALNVV